MENQHSSTPEGRFYTRTIMFLQTVCEVMRNADRRTYAIVAGNIVTLVFGVPGFWAFVSSYRLTGQISPMPWWGWPAIAIASVATLYTTATINGWIHRPQRSPEEIVEEVSNGE